MGLINRIIFNYLAVFYNRNLNIEKCFISYIGCIAIVTANTENL